jgi:hypothetical protein
MRSAATNRYWWGFSAPVDESSQVVCSGVVYPDIVYSEVVYSEDAYSEVEAVIDRVMRDSFVSHNLQVSG